MATLLPEPALPPHPMFSAIMDSKPNTKPDWDEWGLAFKRYASAFGAAGFQLHWSDTHCLNIGFLCAIAKGSACYHVKITDLLSRGDLDMLISVISMVENNLRMLAEDIDKNCPSVNLVKIINNTTEKNEHNPPF